MSDTPLIFDRTLLVRRRERSARQRDRADFLVREVAQGLAERLSTVNRKFAYALDLGTHGELISAALTGTGKIGTVVSTEHSIPLLRDTLGLRVACDEEILPFADASLDLVTSVLNLHAVNDLPGCLAQIRRALRPDGLFLASLLGGTTLQELRYALMNAEIAISGGASPRVAPFADVREIGGLLQRAGFALPVVDAEVLTVRYSGMLDLMRDLRRMGWANVLVARSRTPLRRDVLYLASEIYKQRNADSDGRVRATFEIVNASAWAPHESQQKPLAPGSARMRLADALGVEEFSTSAKASPARERPGNGHPPSAKPSTTD
jgi:NADH dehydrogenase [ubiquinone] 1 alpha subcomplex assembly factor 5